MTFDVYLYFIITIQLFLWKFHPTEASNMSCSERCLWGPSTTHATFNFQDTNYAKVKVVVTELDNMVDNNSRWNGGDGWGSSDDGGSTTILEIQEDTQILPWIKTWLHLTISSHLLCSAPFLPHCRTTIYRNSKTNKQKHLKPEQKWLKDYTIYYRNLNTYL